jgi:hypothetical protein
MPTGRLAYIIFMDESGGVPTHPWVPPGAGATPPGAPSHPIYWPGSPTHPIAPGGQPPGFWGGVAPPYPDIGGPGAQPGPSHPIVLPPGTPIPPPGIWGDINLPTHPIAPGGQPPSTGEPPLGFWGGVPPLQIWGDPIIPAEPPKIISWYAAWSDRTGWVLVGIPNVPAPTPSATKAKK